MYPKLFLVEKWLEELTKEVCSLISPQPALLKNAPFEYRQTHYHTDEYFNNEFYVKEYTRLAKSALSKIDTLRDIQLINQLDSELKLG